jgi:cytochrome c oxidase subunit 3
MTMKQINYSQYKTIHGFHIVTPSPWPLYTSIAVGSMLIGVVMFFHEFQFGGFILIFGLVLTSFILGCWWYDVIIEATFEGNHTSMVQQGLRYGMALFIVSEVMFFFAFFWGFFHSVLTPSIELGDVWPPLGIEPIRPEGLPLLNTLILLSSGAAVTWAHRGFFVPNQKFYYFPYLGPGYFKNLYGYHASGRIEVFLGLLITVLYGVIFTFCQAYEYYVAPFTIADSIYGSTFYVSTGFHGLHVLIGTIFLTVGLIRHLYYHFSNTHHFGFEAAAWYWHFVDVVWLFLYIVIYSWGSYPREFDLMYA